MGVEEIVAKHTHRHDHNSDQHRCKRCSSFVTPEYHGHMVRYLCHRCGPVSEYHEPRAKASGD